MGHEVVVERDRRYRLSLKVTGRDQRVLGSTHRGQ